MRDAAVSQASPDHSITWIVSVAHRKQPISIDVRVCGSEAERGWKSFSHHSAQLGVEQPSVLISIHAKMVDLRTDEPISHEPRQSAHSVSFGTSSSPATADRRRLAFATIVSTVFGGGGCDGGLASLMTGGLRWPL